VAILGICRGSKRFGTELAECLGRGLEYPVLREEIVQDAAGRLGVSVDKLQEKMTGRPTVWEPFSSMRRLYLFAMQAALADRVVDGNLVYHGLTGGLLLHGLPATLTVRCVAPMDMRVRAVRKQSDMDAEAAERYIRDLDQARIHWARVIHGRDVADPGLYDVVVNLGNLGVDAACGMVARMIRQPEYEVTEKVLKGLRDFRTLAHVRLALAEDEELRALDLNVGIAEGRVQITGSAPVRSSGEIGNRIADIARAVPGVKEVHLVVDWFDPYP
jgi:cytidylate kinase